MKLIESSLKNPIAVGMVVVLIAVFGFLSLRELPLQLLSLIHISEPTRPY